MSETGADVQPVVGSELRRVEGESDAKRLVDDGEQRREEGVGALRKAIEGAGAPREFDVLDLFQHSGRRPAVRLSACDRFEDGQARRPQRTVHRAVDHHVGVDEERQRDREPGTPMTASRSPSTSRFSSSGDRKRPLAARIPSSAA